MRPKTLPQADQASRQRQDGSVACASRRAALRVWLRQCTVGALPRHIPAGRADGRVLCPIALPALGHARGQHLLRLTCVRRSISIALTVSDEHRLRQVIYACALEDDLRQFAAGIHTQVGQRGLICSGGQKARISLARALYSSAQVRPRAATSADGRLCSSTISAARSTTRRLSISSAMPSAVRSPPIAQSSSPLTPSSSVARTRR